jgi:hypothetical protein
MYQQKDYKNLVIRVVISPLSFVNRFFICLEDWLVPSLKQIEHDLVNTPNRVIFVFGHPRSGTTNIHKGLSSLAGVATGHYYDILMPSLTLKYLCYPIVALLNKVFFSAMVNAENCPNHKIGPWEELEESLLCLNQH